MGLWWLSKVKIFLIQMPCKVMPWKQSKTSLVLCLSRVQHLKGLIWKKKKKFRFQGLIYRRIRTTSSLTLMCSVCCDGAFSWHYSDNLKEYDDMRTCQMDAMSSEVFDKALTLGWIIRGIEKRNRNSWFSMILKVSRPLNFFTQLGFACFNQRTWGLSTSKGGLFPVRDICKHGSSNQNK